MTLRAYCLQKIQQNGVFLDGACNQYLTTSPTLPPTFEPTFKPSRFVFPTQSPQTLADYNSYFSSKPTSQPTGGNGLPSSSTTGNSNGGGSATVGIAIGIVVAVVVVGAVFFYRRNRKRMTALHEAEFGAGTASRMPVRKEYDVALT